MKEPTIHQVEIVVCSSCLDGIGEECHVPECLFCFRDVPRLEDGTLRQLIDGRGLIDGKLPLDGQLIELEAGRGLTVDEAMKAIDAINDTELDRWTSEVRGVIERVEEHGRHLGPHPWEIEGRVGFFERAEVVEPSDDSDLIDEDPLEGEALVQVLVPRGLHLEWNGTEWVDDRCGCRYHPDDDAGSHGGAPHVHRCEKHGGIDA